MFSAASAAEGTWQAGHSSKQSCHVGQLSQDRSELENPIPNPAVNYQECRVGGGEMCCAALQGSYGASRIIEKQRLLYATQKYEFVSISHLKCDASPLTSDSEVD